MAKYSVAILMTYIRFFGAEPLCQKFLIAVKKLKEAYKNEHVRVQALEQENAQLRLQIEELQAL